MCTKILKRIVLIVVVLFNSQAGYAARPVAITRASVDLNGDRRTDSVAIKMTSGRLYQADVEDGGCMHGAPEYEGKFVIEVRIRGRKPVRQNLNVLVGGFDVLSFWTEHWKIVFDDYNRDGRIDFNLGQYTNCGGWTYWLFTIAPNGRISQLKVEDGNPSSEIFASDDANSTRIMRHTADGFYTKGYYNGADPIGFYTSYYVWNAKKRLFIFKKDVYDRDQKQTYYKPHWAKAK